MAKPIPPRPLALSLNLIARAHAAPVADEPEAQTFLSDVELAPMLARILATRARSEGDLWVFGYGSLIWQPEFSALEQRVATLRGWRRRFCLLQHRFRGSPGKPGLVLALEPGGDCTGLAFRLDAGDPHAVLMPVWRREMKGQGYEARWVALETGEGPVTALTFVANSGSERYAGGLDDRGTAEIIAGGLGSLGASAEYLYRTVAACEALGIADDHLWDLQALVAERLWAVAGRAG